MCITLFPVQYTWDEKKAAKNVRRHGVTFQEAQLALETDTQADYDPDLDSDEGRLRVLAWSPRGRVLFIVIVERTENITRIISARKANASEQADYDESQV